MRKFTFIFMTIILLTVWCSQTIAADNFSANSSFETEGPGGQYTANQWEDTEANVEWYGRSSDAAHTGSYCWKTSTNRPWAGAIQSTNITDLPGKIVTLTTYAMVPNSNPLEGRIVVKLEWLGTTGNQEDYHYVSTNTWTQYSSGSAVAPSNATGVKIVLINEGAPAGTVYYDDVVLNIQDPPVDTNVANGSFEIGTGYDADNWESDGTADVGRTNSYARTGSYSMNISGNWDWANTIQELINNRLSGKTVILKAYALQPSDNPILNNKNGILKLEWLGTNSSAESWFINGDSPKDTWIEGVVTAEAPPGATGFRIVLMKENSTGSLFFDDVEISIVDTPEPGILQNSSFEIQGTMQSKPASWDVNAGWIRTNEVAYAGEWAMRFDFAGAVNWPNTTQIVDVDSSYKSYIASVHALHPDSNPIEGDTGIIKVEFLDSNSSNIGEKTSYFIDKDSPTNTWITGNLSGAIPNGTEKIRFLVMVDANGSGNSGFVFFDKACLILINDNKFIKNPGFETEGCNGVTDAALWYQDNGGLRSTNVARTGNYSIKLSDSNLLTNSVRQQFEYFLMSGEQIIAEVYARQPGVDPLEPGEEAILKVELLDVDGNVVPDGIFEKVVVSNSSPQDTWIEGQLLVTIPSAGADEIVVQLQYNDNHNTNGTVYFDDVNVTIPEPLLTVFLFVVGGFLYKTRRLK